MCQLLLVFAPFAPKCIKLITRVWTPSACMNCTHTCTYVYVCLALVMEAQLKLVIFITSAPIRTKLPAVYFASVKVDTLDVSFWSVMFDRWFSFSNCTFSFIFKMKILFYLRHFLSIISCYQVECSWHRCNACKKIL